MANLITLTTDFGTRDHYVAAMKGAILGIAPQARIVDVSHEVPAYDWRAAAYVLGACHRELAGAVHVVVVDPGVGSERRALAIETRAGWYVGPDNGCLDDAVRDSGFLEAWRIVKAGRAVSATFHGRDLFAPLAARLAAGLPTAGMLQPTDWRPRQHALRARRTAGGASGRVVWVDRFGNLITTVTREDLAGTKQVSGTVGGRRVDRLVRTYADAGDGEPFWIWGSGGRLEVSVKQGSAAEALGVSAGCTVRVSGR